MVTFMWAKSTIWIMLAPAATSSPSSTLSSFTVPSKPASRVSPLERRRSRSPLSTWSPSATYTVRTVAAAPAVRVSLFTTLTEPEKLRALEMVPREAVYFT